MISGLHKRFPVLAACVLMSLACGMAGAGSYEVDFARLGESGGTRAAGADRAFDYIGADAAAGPVQVSASYRAASVLEFGIAPLLRLIQPNGGTHMGGAPTQFQWESDPNSAGTGVRLELWRGNIHVEDIGYGYDPSGTGGETLELPRVPEANDYRVRVISTFSPQLFDESDDFLTILGGPVRVKLPNGGESWEKGTLQNILWKSNPLYSGMLVKLELWSNGSKVSDLGQGFDPFGEAVTQVQVPNVDSGDAYRVRAVSIFDSQYYDESDQPFVIHGPQTAVRAGTWEMFE